jgi:hypothetical protein
MAAAVVGATLLSTGWVPGQARQSVSENVRSKNQVAGPRHLPQLVKDSNEREALTRALYPEPWHYPYATLDAAADAALLYLREQCGTGRPERGGYIVKVSFSHRAPVYVPTPYLIGTEDGVNLGEMPANTVATYHTHPDIEGYDTENPSPQDRKEADENGIIYYIGTPTRLLAYHPALLKANRRRAEKGRVRIVHKWKSAPALEARKSLERVVNRITP